MFQSIFTEELFSVKESTTIVINESWETISEEEKKLLSRILNAIKLSLDAVIIKSQATLNLSDWVHKPTHLIFFGDPVKGLAQYEVLVASGVTIVTSASLKQLAQDEPLRKKLWQALKKQFSIGDR
jgi:DNA polymerase III psi subunit